MAALAGAAFVASRPAPGTVAFLLSAAVYQLGAAVCHQLPERSFRLWDVQLAVCARCAGIYAGAVASTVAVALRRPGVFERAVWRRTAPLVLVAAVPSALSLLYEWGLADTPGNWTRAAAGFPLGAAVMLVLLAAPVVKPAVGVH
jgi:uncharacterized membrane protein